MDEKNEVDYSGGESSQQHPSSSDQNGSSGAVGDCQVQYISPVSRELTTKRAREESGPEVKEKSNEPISKDLATERAKWLEEEINKGPEVKEKSNEPISKDLATERARQLEEISKPHPENKSIENAPISRKIADEKMKMIRDQQLKWTQLGQSPSSKERTQNNDTLVERSLAEERMQMIKDQQLKWTQLGKSPNKENSASAQPSKETANIKQKMTMIKQQQKKFNNLGKTQMDSKPEPITRNLASEKMTMIKQQQEKFNNLGKTQMDSKPEPIKRNLASEKMTMIKQQQEKFNNLGKKSAVLEGDKKVESSNEATLNSSGETVKPKTAVQKRKEALENAQKEAAKRNDPKAHVKILWKQKGVNRFQKVTEDERGIAPKKSLDELP